MHNNHGFLKLHFHFDMKDTKGDSVKKLLFPGQLSSEKSIIQTPISTSHDIMQKLVPSSTLQQHKSHPITQNLNLSDIVQTQAASETYNTFLYDYFLDTYFRLPFCKDTFITTNSSQAGPRNEQKQNFCINDDLSLELREIHPLNPEPFPPLHNLNIAFHHNQQPILILT